MDGQKHGGRTQVGAVRSAGLDGKSLLGETVDAVGHSEQRYSDSDEQAKAGGRERPQKSIN